MFSVSYHISVHLKLWECSFRISLELPDLLTLSSSPPHSTSLHYSISFPTLPAASDVVVTGELWKQPDSLESVSGKQTAAPIWHWALSRKQGVKKEAWSREGLWQLSQGALSRALAVTHAAPSLRSALAPATQAARWGYRQSTHRAGSMKPALRGMWCPARLLTQPAYHRRFSLQPW